RERPSHCMWDDVGILRTRDGLRAALTALGDFRAELHETGLADGDRAFNMTWHDWMNLESQIDTSAVVATAALGREDSRGAHFREDFPETGALEETSFTRITQTDTGLALEMVPVDFSIVAPGQSLIEDEAGAPPSAAE
ncbi:MAG: succinate dehydrogenase/fumarate reductase flavoprotein subunit, partial [Nitratireductor sp.]